MKLFGLDLNRNEDLTEEGIISLVEEGHEQGVLKVEEKEMIQNIFELSDKEASNIMTPRNNILAVDETVSLKDALNFAIDVKKSRIPVYADNADHPVGILHFRDAVIKFLDASEALKQTAIKDIDGLLRDAVFVPETKKVDLLFKEMQKNKLQMVIVVDEYGQTQGIIAMEDILEEIVGNIQDEYDEEEDAIKESSNDNEYIIDGLTRLDELEDKFDISFDESEFETLNGFMISKLEHIPEEGESFETFVGDYSFKILKVENKCIKTVIVKRR